MVIAHPDGGFQLIGGTVEAGESVLDAAIRECREESGLVLENPRILWEEVTLLDKPQFVLLEGVKDADSCVLQRGHPVEALEIHETHADIVQREYDLCCDPPREIRTHHGRVNPRCLGSEIVRFFIYGQADHEESEWQRIADGREFRLRWMPIHESYDRLLVRDRLILSRFLDLQKTADP